MTNWEEHFSDSDECDCHDPYCIHTENALRKRIEILEAEVGLLNKRIESQTDWYQQRFNALRIFVENEVRPLSSDVAHRYYSIVANGSPDPHESADWSNTMHAAKMRYESAEAEVERLKAELREAIKHGKWLQGELTETKGQLVILKYGEPK